MLSLTVDEDILRVVESYGYPRKLINKSLQDGDLNQGTAAYNLLALS